MSTGVSTLDFNQILADEGVQVQYKTVTKTIDAMTGSEVSTFATAVPITVVFFLNDKKFVWDPEGLVQLGDAYILAPLSVGVKRYDQFSTSTDTFYIENVYRRTVAGVDLFDFAQCFKVQ